MSEELKAFKEAVSHAERMWRDQRKGRAMYEDVVIALDTAEKMQSEALQQQGAYSAGDKTEFYRISGVLRDMKGVIIRCLILYQPVQ
jgi:hypothetical protein